MSFHVLMPLIWKQLKEMGGSKPSDRPEVSEQPFDKKKGFGDWVNLIKPGNEEKDHWVRFLFFYCLGLVS